MGTNPVLKCWIRRDPSYLCFLEIISCVHIYSICFSVLCSSLLLSLLFLKIPFLPLPPHLSWSCSPYISYALNPSLSWTVREGDNQNKKQLPFPSVWMWGSEIIPSQPGLSTQEINYWWEQSSFQLLSDSRRKAHICFLPFVPSSTPIMGIVMLSAPMSWWICYHKCGSSLMRPTDAICPHLSSWEQSLRVQTFSEWAKFKLLLCSAVLWFNTPDISSRKH